MPGLVCGAGHPFSVEDDLGWAVGRKDGRARFRQLSLGQTRVRDFLKIGGKGRRGGDNNWRKMWGRKDLERGMRAGVYGGR